jgi:ribulose-phosphate 3-epimerase
LNISSAYLISASILASDFSRLGEQIHEAELAGADWIHVDVMDGHFVPNLTLGPVIVEACRKVSQLPLDVHMMVETPENLIAAFANAGSSILSVHVETCHHLPRTIQNIHELGCKAGVVLNPSTPVDLVRPVLPMVDLVLIMSVNPGYSGQLFMPEVLPKLSDLRRELDKLDQPVWLEIDGGINANTIPLAREAGANVFVAASAIFKHPDGIASGIHQLRAQLSN